MFWVAEALANGVDDILREFLVLFEDDLDLLLQF